MLNNTEVKKAHPGKVKNTDNYHLPFTNKRKYSMNIHLTIMPLLSLIAGILILIVPKLLNLIVAIYLIVIGLVGLFGTGRFPLH